MNDELETLESGDPSSLSRISEARKRTKVIGGHGIPVRDVKKGGAK